MTASPTITQLKDAAGAGGYPRPHQPDQVPRESKEEVLTNMRFIDVMTHKDEWPGTGARMLIRIEDIAAVIDLGGNCRINFVGGSMTVRHRIDEVAQAIANLLSVPGDGLSVQPVDGIHIKDALPLISEAQRKEMIERFLAWQLPSDFHPDGGITFEPIGSKGTEHEFRRRPYGTNLLNFKQAAEMVEHMLGLTNARRIATVVQP